jgi:glutamate dehydrogenase
MKEITAIAQGTVLSEEQLRAIEQKLLETRNFTQERIRREIEWFCCDLGIDRYYFETTPADLIARHIESLRAAEIIARNSGAGVDLQLASEQPDQAIYLVAATQEAIDEVERRIEARYALFRMQSYRTKGKSLGTFFRLYFVSTPRFANAQTNGKPTFEEAADQVFLRQSPPRTRERYKAGWELAEGRLAPLVEVSEVPESGETRVLVILKRDSSKRFIYEFSHVLDTYGLHTNRKYVEPFLDDKIGFSFYLNRIDDAELLETLTRDITAVVIMPANKISSLFFERHFSAEEVLYCIAVSHFSNQFLTSDSEEFKAIAATLEGNPEIRGMLGNLKMKMVKDTYTPSRIADTILKYPEIARECFRQFKFRMYPQKQRSSGDELTAPIMQRIASESPWEVERRILKCFLTFNQTVLKTNFFKSEKACLAFRLDPSFLDQVDYPESPFGIFYLIGKEFRGFHVRFKDIARGGIRLVKSRSEEIYDFNSDFIFDENYNLSLTQQLKNKDIPEGGSKGTVLLHLDSQDKAESAFKNYIEGLLDLLLPDKEVTDAYGRNEILFLGPDENTAEMMDWACLRARGRGYPFWKSFTTGKYPSLGGVPHDLHGMTTQSIHQYVLGVLEELGLEEEKVTKIQTGGPDGDLGSNEIKISKDRTLAVIDGSGVLYDPQGINRGELLRLAEERRMVRHFDRSCLSPGGFLITVEDRNITLPNGTVIPNGEHLRDIFHLLPDYSADLFVPCGGRPRSINIGNWKQMLDRGGKPRFRAIVEGANLFLTQDARLRLEEAGVILIKDASANKGGVTSSSLEVLASLVLDDAQYEACMTVVNGKEPEFRKRYVAEIIEKIRNNARLEFLALQKENLETGVPRSIVCDHLSRKINGLADAVENSPILGDPMVIRWVIEAYCPPVLVEYLGMEKLLERLPASYLAATVASHVASTYVYRKGLRASEVDFYSFLEELRGSNNPKTHNR